ncbi:putative leucine-rich repeat receptor-like serine/threonine-protein kinase At2g24130 [Phoenix dactylifera]|uniref:non-specific serine/threonine protein kinase n=1 Tax=Phoenix dactylifera TaxID=42345 RepID=A0A8B9ACE0_PHODC|nr:putative leucine-rich repeat receptor-like serine/threonine-protein kinase At2g24130 [Phoenix dactylifera]
MAKVITKPSLVTSPQKSIAFTGLKHAIFLLLLLLFQHVVSVDDHPLSDPRDRAITLQEKATLLSFKNSITSQPQAALANWNESTDVCDFEGVVCDRWRLHVVHLLLGSRLASGLLSPVLANLTSLRKLDLSNNSLTGHIPHEFSNLRHLMYLNLSKNYLDGQIPQSLASLTRLQSLDLFDNNLQGHILVEFCNLRHLTYLDLSENHLDGRIPQCLASLTGLQHLDLANNSLQGHIPVEFSNLRDLMYLNLSESNLHGQIPQSLANLTELQSLDLFDNNLQGYIPVEFCNLRHLIYLDLSENHLDGRIPQCLASLTGLQHLDLADNSLQGHIPMEFSNLRDLMYLDLSESNLDGQIPQSLANLTELQRLDLSDNNLHGHIPVEFSNLQHLQFLELSGNLLDGPIPQSLATITNLVYIDLGNNSLTGQIPASIFRNCSKLRAVDFSANDLSGEIPSDARIYLPNLHILNLYQDNLTGKLPSWLSNSSLLRQLDVGYNFLSGELPVDIVSNKTDLLYLDMSYNNFSSHHNNTDLRPFFLAISNCSKLLELEMEGLGLGGPLPQIAGSVAKTLSIILLGDNMISGPIPPSIGSLFNITLLNLSNNLLRGTIPTQIGQLLKLERLILSHNLLTGAVPAEIGNISKMGLLDLSNNRLSGEIPRSLGNLNLISEIHLQKNQLYGEIPVSLGRCMRLDKLDLSYNRLTGRIPLEMSSIAKISFNLSHNQLQGPLPIELSKMDHVQEIDLSSNNLTGVVISQLSACAELERINLSHNSLQGQLPKSFGDLRNLEALDVSFNYLAGDIPSSLNNCTSLTQLNLSYNDFNGPIPMGGVFSSFTNLSYLGNPQLCGPVVGRARFKRRRWLHLHKFLILICVGASVLAFLLAVCCVIIGIRKTQGRIFRGRGDACGGSSLVLRSSFPRITYRDLVKATGEFDQDSLIGSGSYGRVYKGVLRDGTIVAVKVLHLQAGNAAKIFNRECQVLKRIRHRNLMRIITACSRPDFKALVLPFMANGSLDSFLHSGSSELSLTQRVNICSDIAEAVAYLHHHSPVKVIHCDLKPSNVLLNDDMTALVADFGIASLVMNGGAGSTTDMGSSTANMLRGSVGYIAPEYGFGSGASTRGDVYSFGVLVLEVVTRKRPTDEMFEGGLSLPKWVKGHYNGRVERVIDASLVTAAKNQTCEARRMWEVAIGELVDLGLLCTQESPSTRPTMLDAADDLGRLKRHLSGDTSASVPSSLGMSSSTTGEDPGASISNLD